MDGGRFERSEDQAYDHAYETKGNCETLYPACRYSIYDMDFWKCGESATDFAFDSDNEIFAKFFWRLSDFSALTSALALRVLFPDEYRSPITDKTRRAIAWSVLLSLQTFQTPPRLKKAIWPVVFLYSKRYFRERRYIYIKIEMSLRNSLIE